MVSVIREKKRKIRMPRTRAEFEALIMNAFIAGCQFGYGNVHTHDLQGQEELGAMCWVGKISEEELEMELDKIRSQECSLF